MSGAARRIMIRLGQPNMFGWLAALARAFGAKGALPPFIPRPSAEEWLSESMGL